MPGRGPLAVAAVLGASIASGALAVGYAADGTGQDRERVAWDASVQTMFYKPEKTGRLWDTWLFYRDGTFYLYHLSGEHVQWHGVSLATSPDGVHWSEHGLVLHKAEDAVWMGSGSVYRSPVTPDKFLMNTDFREALTVTTI